MIKALYSAGSGMTAQQMSVDNIANNLANASTTGFKARRTQFQDLLYQSYLQPGAAAGSQTVVPTGLQIGMGTRPSANSIVFTQGAFTETDNPLDLVIQGKGFFQIKRPTGRHHQGEYLLQEISSSIKTATSSPRWAIPLSPRSRFPPPRRPSPSPMEPSATPCPDRPRRRSQDRSGASPTSPIPAA